MKLEQNLYEDHLKMIENGMILKPRSLSCSIQPRITNQSTIRFMKCFSRPSEIVPKSLSSSKANEPFPSCLNKFTNSKIYSNILTRQRCPDNFEQLGNEE